MRASDRIHRGMLREAIAENINDMGDDIHDNLEDHPAAQILYDAEDEMDNLAHDDLAPRRGRRPDDRDGDPFGFVDDFTDWFLGD